MIFFNIWSYPLHNKSICNILTVVTELINPDEVGMMSRNEINKLNKPFCHGETRISKSASRSTAES